MGENVNDILGLNTSVSSEEVKAQENVIKLKNDSSTDNLASKQLLNLNKILEIIGFLALISGLICFLIGLSDYGDNQTILGITIFVGGLNIFIIRVFVNSLIQITKSAEYYNARIEASKAMTQGEPK